MIAAPASIISRVISISVSKFMARSLHLGAAHNHNLT